MDNVGKIIWNQLKAMDTNLMMCMGVRNLTLIESGLRFKVSGLKFKGLVKVTLNSLDLYDVELVKMKRSINKEFKELGIKKYDTNPETVGEFKGIFFDELTSLLEREVEGR